MYIKFDKKLILKIGNLDLSSNSFISHTINENSSTNDTNEISNNIKKLPFILDLFQQIDIKRVKIKDNEFTITLNDKYIYIDNKFVNLSADLKFEGPNVLLDIYSIYLKETKTLFEGKSNINIDKKIVNFFGKYIYKELSGEVNLQLYNDTLDFYINSSQSVKSMDFLKDFFRLDSVAESWMYDNVSGDINLKYLYGKIDLKKQEAIMDSLKGQVIINDAKIRFHKNAKTVNTKKLTIDYENDTLSFNLDKPVYNKSKLYGSKVYIENLTSEEKGEVIVDLKTKSMLNNDILEILKAYDITLPLKQKSGKANSSIIIKVPYLDSKKIDINGVFYIHNGILVFNNVKFFTKKVKVSLKNHKVIIEDSNIIYKKILNANLNLNIDTNTSTAQGNILIKSFNLDSSEKSLINMKGLKTNIFIDFKKNTFLDLSLFKTQVNILKEKVDININDLELFYPYSNLLKTIDIKKGNLYIDFFNKDNIDFKINAKELNFPFYKNGNKINTLSANGSIKKNKISINTNDSDIQIILHENKNTLIKLNNIDLFLLSSEKKSGLEVPDIDLELKNSIIKLENENEYKAKWANINIKDSKINFIGKALDLDLPISKSGKKVQDLILYGTYENQKLDIQTKDSKLKLKYNVPNEKISMQLNGYDVLYDTNIEEDKESNISYFINGINSNIIINNKYIVKSNKYSFIFENYKTDINLTYKNTKFLYQKDYLGNIKVDAKNMNDEFLNSLINKNLIKDGSINLTASGKNSLIKGSADLKNTNIVDLAILNNLLIFINTSPALINPLLAIPSVVGMATSGGFNLNGYKVIEGKVDFEYGLKNKFLNMHKIFTKGNGIDFDGYSTIDFNNSKINSKLKLIFLKDYSKIVGLIPVIDYVLLGEKNRIDTEVEIFGTLDNPKYKTKLAKEGVSVPINIIKRIILTPIKIIEKITGEDDKTKKE
ncbi:MAG: DUF3971 domain-containing protein [Arcobacter sp.]|nr:DUF3971 domain-containing protein [Arcobacter sp.]